MKTKMVRRPDRREDDPVLNTLEPGGRLLPSMVAYRLREIHDGLTQCDSNPGAAFSPGVTETLTWDDLEAIFRIVESASRRASDPPEYVRVVLRGLAGSTAFSLTSVGDVYECLTGMIEGKRGLSPDDAIEALPKILDVASTGTGYLMDIAASVRSMAKKSAVNGGQS